MKLGLVIALTCSGWVSTRAALSPDEHFREAVKPLLDSRCISCHGPDKVKGGLRLDSRDAVLKGGDSGPSVTPGQPGDSLLLQAVLHAKKDLEMPPKEKLSTKDVAVLERWIKDGAPWPKATAAARPSPAAAGVPLGNAWTDPRNPIVRIFGGQRLDLWSLKPIRQPVPPRVQHVRSVRNPIDSFVLAKIEEVGLRPSLEADRRTLARRLYFDLTGLPPTPAQMQAYLEDRGPGAYERLVDRLLDSREYGEHWARQWLDVVRYSDSNGFDWDEFRRQAWRFRDYVVRAFNADKRFDQFIVEQLAGDELLEGPPRDEREQDLLIATGYLRLGPHDNSAAAFNEQGRSRAELMADLVETTGSAFLGLTLACCRCHDHKYDPLSQADHFRMRAFFEGVRFADDLPLDLAEEQRAIRQQHRGVEAEIKPLQTERENLLSPARAALEAKRKAGLSAEDQALLDRRRADLSAEQKKKAEELEQRIKPSDKDVKAGLEAEEKKREAELAGQIEQLNKTKKPFTFGLLMTDSDSPPPLTKILFQGDYKAEREAVEPGIISALDPNPAPPAKGQNSNTLGRRLALARWIASAENPLTARVIVNRVWQSHFGRGLVSTPNDFGLAGARPTHPELLDWLASEFMREGWSLKKLHRLIVTSATYRQRSSSAGADSSTLIRIGGRAKEMAAFDSENKWLSRQNLRRLSAEQLRDALLAVSGKLARTAGGPPVWPELPAEVLAANPAFLDDNAEKTKGWYPSAKPEQNVRSVFLVQKRTVKIPFLETFDLPDNAVSCPRRNESVVAPQALSLLNGPLAVECARTFAARLDPKAWGEDSVRQAFALAFQRAPDAEELEACLRLARSRGLAALCRSLLNANEFVYVD